MQIFSNRGLDVTVSVHTHFADPDALSSSIPNTRAAIQTTTMTKTPVPTSSTATLLAIVVKQRYTVVGQLTREVGEGGFYHRRS